VPAGLSHFFAQNVAWTIGIIAIFIFMFLPRSGGIFGSWIVRVVLVVMIAFWAWIALVNFADKAKREMDQKVAQVEDWASGIVPDWAKPLWEKIKTLIPSPEDKFCEYMGMSTGCNILNEIQSNLARVSNDITATNSICKSSQAALNQFGGETSRIAYCDRYGANVQRELKAISLSTVKALITSKIPGFLLPTPPSLETRQYLQCLANSTPPVINDCHDYQTDRHLWRLCAEFHIQLPSERLQEPPAPLSPKIQACRDALSQTPQ